MFRSLLLALRGGVRGPEGRGRAARRRLLAPGWGRMKGCMTTILAHTHTMLLLLLLFLPSILEVPGTLCRVSWRCSLSKADNYCFKTLAHIGQHHS